MHKAQLRRRFSSKSRFHFCLSLKAYNGGTPHGDTSRRGSRRVLSGRTLRGGLQTSFQPVACSLCADGVRRYSARINAFILLPLYYSGAAQGSQGGTKNDSECPPRCFGHNLRKNILVFVDLENLRIFQIYFFTGGAVKANSIARFHRNAMLPKEAALQMQFTAETFPVKRGPRSVRRRSGVPKS